MDFWLHALSDVGNRAVALHHSPLKAPSTYGPWVVANVFASVAVPPDNLIDGGIGEAPIHMVDVIKVLPAVQPLGLVQAQCMALQMRMLLMCRYRTQQPSSILLST